MPGKTEVSFKQWYHKVQCIKDYYLELVVWESIIRSLKRGSSGYCPVHGPYPSMTHIMQRLAVIFGTMASFYVLMQNIYKVTQGNHEKISSFATRLVGTLKQIRLQFPGRIIDLEVQQHLKDCLFHGVCKHIWDSISDLYITPRTSYSHLMSATLRAERENVEIWDKVRARAAMATNSREGATELGQQIAKLMAILSKAGQGSNAASAPSSPKERCHGRGQADRGTLGCPSSHNGQNSLGQTASQLTNWPLDRGYHK